VSAFFSFGGWWEAGKLAGILTTTDIVRAVAERRVT